MTCELCRARPVADDEMLCEACKPTDCYKCSSSSVTYDGMDIRCSHGCEYDVHTHMSHHLYTIIMNGSWRERLRYAGERIEYIISDPDAIEVFESCPPKEDGWVRGIHFSPDTEYLLEEGYDMEYSTGEHRTGLRGESAYAWPFIPEVATSLWSGEYVYFKMPVECVSVSSYRYIDWIGETGRWAIPYERYEERLVFTPDQLFTIVNEENLPVDRSDLLYFTA